MLLLLLACAAEPPANPAPLPVCGDGILADDEACDDGADNSDTVADACRTTCLAPACGDGVADAGEACDDGGAWGGDGCDAACAVEDGTLEAEPNGTAAEATAAGEQVHGALPAGDVDCWSVALPRCGALSVEQVEPCTSALTMALYGPDGALVAAGAPGEDACAALDPADQPGARWVAEGTWTVCVEAVADGVVPSYTLEITTPDAADLDAADADDLDDDGEPDSCDLDADGDGVSDDTDNCDDVSNGPETTLALGSTGYVRTWLAAGPYTGDASTDNCRPAEEARAGEDQPVTATVGDAAGTLTWTAHLLTSDSFDLLTFASVDAPREAYALVYLESDTARTATLSVGADDGVFAWWNGALVMDVASCQGVVADQFQASVDVVAGWNTLLFKVRDQGGGWGLAAHLLDESGTPITDLRPGLAPDGSWLPDQSDTDGDGEGDVCDDG